MPCNSDYMRPNHREIELSRLYFVWANINGQPVNREWLRGYHPKAYNQSVSMNEIDRMTKACCEKLKTILNPGALELETQIWWRDHQEWDAQRDAQEEAWTKGF